MPGGWKRVGKGTSFKSEFHRLVLPDGWKEIGRAKGRKRVS